MAERKILHIDLDAFYCAVEELLDPELKGKAFAVGGAPGQRGVVSSCSYPARRYGVRSAMPMSRALQLCPNLITVRGHYQAYSEASKKTMAIIESLTPLVEQISIDEAFLDVTDLMDSGKVIALSLQASILAQVGLPSSLGVATNKLVAKIANNIGKSEHRGDTPPCAIKVIPAGGEEEFLAPLPTKELWGIGPKTAERLKYFGIETIGDIAAKPEAWLVSHFGKAGPSLSRHAKGIDNRPVVTFHDTKSISNEVTFNKDIMNEEELEIWLRRLSEKVGGRLRKSNFCAHTVRVKLRWSNFSTHTRQVTLIEPFDQESVIFEAAWGLFKKLWQHGKPVRLLGVGVTGLEKHAVQLKLWETKEDRERRLFTAVDDLRERFGKGVIQRGYRIKKKDDS